MNNQKHWKGRFNEMMETCRDEIRRTTIIGKKMLTASRATAGLNEAYRKLGRLVEKNIPYGPIDSSHSGVNELLEEIKKRREELAFIESDVHKIKAASETSEDYSRQGPAPAGPTVPKTASHQSGPESLEKTDLDESKKTEN